MQYVVKKLYSIEDKSMRCRTHIVVDTDLVGSSWTLAEVNLTVERKDRETFQEGTDKNVFQHF